LVQCSELGGFNQSTLTRRHLGYQGLISPSAAPQSLSQILCSHWISPNIIIPTHPRGPWPSRGRLSGLCPACRTDWRKNDSSINFSILSGKPGEKEAKPHDPNQVPNDYSRFFPRVGTINIALATRSARSEYGGCSYLYGELGHGGVSSGTIPVSLSHRISPNPHR
jgi:hypothetical protein